MNWNILFLALPPHELKPNSAHDSRPIDGTSDAISCHDDISWQSETSSTNEERRATWLETRNTEENFKELFYLTLQEVSAGRPANIEPSHVWSTSYGLEVRSLALN